jgi:hypothetical protein
MRLRLLRSAVSAVAPHPSLWWIGLVQLRRLAPRGWWRRPPFLPLPDPAYLRFRLQTMYGDSGHALEPEAMRTYLHWCRSFPAANAGAHVGRNR